MVVVESQLPTNRGQPERLHLSVERKPLVQILGHGLGFSSISGQGERKACFGCCSRALGRKFERFRGALPRFCRTAEDGFPLGSNRQIDRSYLFVVGSYRRVYRALYEFSRLGDMANKSFGVRCERQSEVLIFGLACKPLLLFRHPGGVRAKKRESVAGIPQLENI